MSEVFHLHLVSDATGETVHHLARACISQFPAVHGQIHRWNLIRSQKQLELVIDGMRRNRGVVYYTLVDESLRNRLKKAAEELGLPCVDVIAPAIGALSSFVGSKVVAEPGRQHTLDADYFRRIEAFDFALAHDDGQSLSTLARGDVVLVGVSRTSKTPTCFYLANQGIRAGNVPLVRGCPPPAELDGLERVLIVGLTKDPSQLVQIRRSRFRFWKQRQQGDYVNLEQVHEEVQEAKRYFGQRNWPVIDVSQRSIEETAAEVVMLLERHQSSWPEKKE
jgi:regulator of PEP synthase PpsR (kinase-PPPase family)